MTDQERYSDKYVKDWLRSLKVLHRGHWDAARYYERFNLLIGFSTAITAAISGASAFTQMADQIAQQVGTNLVGIFGIIAAVLAAIQTSIRPSELATKHKHAGVKYGQIRRQLEEALDLGLPTDHGERLKLLDEFRSNWSAVDDETLPVPQRIYKRVKCAMDKKCAEK